ncbi:MULTISPECIES: D-mannonate dehydratase ManD [unclassified Actinotalea]|uniref:D-mannonate dehydratase ManD n=1 Tax=unclassified Actinotalea TaxID=2638618 RepID=UPI0015F3ABDB|nr:MULTISPECIES: D-mannonate dehydratase ManD [unclassified Actinotalea]
MRIERADVVVTSPGRNFVTLRLETTDGLVGLGDATLNGRELSVASYLRDHVAPLLVGRDARNIEDTWQYLSRGAYWRRGPVTMTAIAAVDMALWDLKGKAAGMPVYQLLGGRSRRGALAYGHASGTTLDALMVSIRNHLDRGFRAIRLQTGVPGLGKVYGVGTDQGVGQKYDYEPAGRTAAPVEEDWDTRAYLRHIPSVFEAVRAEFGPELPLLHDAHHRLSPNEAAQLGRSLEPYDLFWLEDVTPADNPEALRRVRAMTTTPLAIGEVLTSIHDYRQLITEQLIDFVRSSPAHAGGITGVKKLMDLAALYGIRSGFHQPTDISPVGMAAALHLDIALHNFGIQEFMEHNERTLEVFRTSYTFTDGLLDPGETPGLGVDLDLELAAQFEYTPAYLPVNRLRDGTLHDW